jgi:2-hydroxy-3-keto-5-methylthiopentenyl-1-phosphate phosphatase
VKRSLVVDFDGTVSENDMLDTIARRFGDEAVYQHVEDELHAGRMSLQEVITTEFRPVKAPLEEVVAWTVEHTRVRPGFHELVELARSRGYGFVVLSSGFVELIEPVLAREGVEADEIRANTVDARRDGWRVQWRDEAVCEVCGEACKRGGLPDGEVVFVGDGISDRCAAEAADRVFATKGLARYLDERGIAYEPFDDFHDVVGAFERLHVE